jgi:anthranilate synthase/aminodeoxychorismate synthase-like glutamine amidotransferase
MIDNYDSFVYNLVQYLREMGQEVQVYRNDKITLDKVKEIRPAHIIISPGPCTPNKAGISLEIIKAYSGKIPILGVCLGHQAIGQAFGGSVIRASRPVHGKISRISHNGRGVFLDLPQQLKVGRYHSLVVSAESVPD